MPIYPGDPSPSFEHYSTLQKHGVNLTKITMGSHTGTHLDAPRHFIQDGIGIDRIPPDKLIGEAYVADLSRKPIGSGITSQDLRPDLEEKTARRRRSTVQGRGSTDSRRLSTSPKSPF